LLKGSTFTQRLGIDPNSGRGRTISLRFNRGDFQDLLRCEASNGADTMGVRGRPAKWDRWYSTTRWARIRKHQLREHPLCKYCLERGIVEPATIVDHVEPHRGDVSRHPVYRGR
jgi:5-methylcytosine-specific restriction endonuclease McrA